ncbi:hypothetical protein F5879DRAFT_1033650 [Lentinula edodes]|nr:hypothetical protein F5879DRAFT_1033650 [Lentinula edodes]
MEPMTVTLTSDLRTYSRYIRAPSVRHWESSSSWTSSAALVTKLEKDEKKHLAAQVKRLGPGGIKAAAKELEEAKVEHDKPLPTTVLTQCQIASVKSISWIPVQCTHPYRGGWGVQI